MIDLIFEFGSEYTFVRVQGSNIFFRTQESQSYGTIDGLKLDYTGTIREFPDLETNKEWKKEAIKRLKEKIKKMKDEKERAKYVIEDLSKHGYKIHTMQVNGFRPVKF